jgi:hypothetical protein
MNLVIEKPFCETFDSKNQMEPSALTIDETFSMALEPFHDNAVETPVPDDHGCQKISNTIAVFTMLTEHH